MLRETDMRRCQDDRQLVPEAPPQMRYRPHGRAVLRRRRTQVKKLVTFEHPRLRAFSYQKRGKIFGIHHRTVCRRAAMDVSEVQVKDAGD